LARYPLAINNPWFCGEAVLQSYAAEELVATKFRAFLQRRKDRDLFDLGQCFDRLTLNNRVILTCFQHYLGNTALSFTRANVEEILLKKLTKSFIDDIRPLLPTQVNYREAQALQAFKTLWRSLEKHSARNQAVSRSPSAQQSCRIA